MVEGFYDPTTGQVDRDRKLSGNSGVMSSKFRFLELISMRHGPGVGATGTVAGLGTALSQCNGRISSAQCLNSIVKEAPGTLLSAFAGLGPSSWYTWQSMFAILSVLAGQLSIPDVAGAGELC